MRKIIVSLHTSLDGFMAGPNGEMNWIKVDQEMFDFGKGFTDNADTALYGRVTWQMMDGYWPTAAEKPNASKHDIDHSKWYNSVNKVVISKSMKGQKKELTTFIGDNIAREIMDLKHQNGKNILIFGSPSVVRLLIQENLVDEYWLFINPIILGKGISMFPNIENRIPLKLIDTRTFSCGVIGLNFIKEL